MALIQDSLLSLLYDEDEEPVEITESEDEEPVEITESEDEKEST